MFINREIHYHKDNNSCKINLWIYKAPIKIPVCVCVHAHTRVCMRINGTCQTYSKIYILRIAKTVIIH